MANFLRLSDIRCGAVKANTSGVSITTMFLTTRGIKYVPSKAIKIQRPIAMAQTVIALSISQFVQDLTNLYQSAAVVEFRKGSPYLPLPSSLEPEPVNESIDARNEPATDNAFKGTFVSVTKNATLARISVADAILLLFLKKKNKQSQPFI